jgi:outer membrane protein OmpA-like peptidoglycan-associated protein
MEKTITKHLPKTILVLGISVFAYGCSSQSISIPGGQLVGQQKKSDCIDKKTGKPIPGCIIGNTAGSTTKSKREPLRLLADKPKVPVVPRKTIIKAEKAPVVMTKPASEVGVVASEAKIPTTAVMTKPMVMTKPAPVVQAQRVAPAPAPRVTAIPRPAPTKVQTETTRRLTLSGSATFKTGSSSLTRAGKAKLATLARTLKGPGTKVTRLLIEGHTDSVGAAAFNQVLSLKRANAVADYLSLQGLIRSSMETAGRGESSPVASNKTKAGRAQNRRVEITATGTRQTNR